MAKIILAGGSGFIGQALAPRFAAKGDEVIVLSRGKGREPQGDVVLHWDGKTLGSWAEALEGAELVINLTGKSVDCRYSEKNKKIILDSRVDSTRILGDAIQRAKVPPKLWINLSTATIYRHAEDRPMDEETGEIGSGFSVNVAKAWEGAFFAAATPKTRKVALRSAVVLGRNGGALIPFKNLVRAGLGGVQGDGRQMFSWLHEEDLFEIIQFIRSHDGITGALNGTAPDPLSDREVMTILRQALHMPFGVPLPGWLLTIGAWLIRTEPELLLKSRWVIPARLLKAGYRFKYPTFSEAIADLI